MLERVRRLLRYAPLLLLVAVSAAPALAQHADRPTEAEAIDRLVARCRESNTRALYVFRDGRPLVVWDFADQPPEVDGGHGCNLMSATKSITCLAVGLLIDEGRIPSVDTPVQRFFPEYRGKWKDQVTIRHLLEHTSGIRLYQDDPGGVNSDRFPVNRVASALRAPIVSRPGSRFAYNNRAVDLLSGVVRRAAGMPLDDYLRQRLFRPLGITEVIWQRDPDGNPHGCAELVLRPADMAKIGQLMLKRGVWQGKRVLSERFIEQATRPSKITDGTGNACGWLWWICQPWFTLDDSSFDQMAKAGLTAQQIARIRPLIGEQWPNLDDLILDVDRILGPRTVKLDWYKLIVNAPAPIDFNAGFYANGWGGQWVLVLPKERIVAVRTCAEGFYDTRVPAKYEMGDFFRVVRALGAGRMP